MTKTNFWLGWWLGVTPRCERAIAPRIRASAGFARPALLVALLLVLAPVGLVLTQSRLHASGNTITVNNTTDPASTSGNGFCTLREAINNANSPGTNTTCTNTIPQICDCPVGTGADTIIFCGVSGTGTITLGSGLPAIKHTLTIDGRARDGNCLPAAGQTITIDGANSYGVLAVYPGGTVNLNDLTIAHGSANVVGTGNVGGGVSNYGTLTVTNCTFSGNSATASGNLGAGGAGVFNDGTLTVTNCTFSGNTVYGVNGFGGGVFNYGTLTVTNSTFSANIAGYSGGAVYNDNLGGIANSLIVTNSTFSGNSAHLFGGGIGNFGSLTVTNSAFLGNSTDYVGGGVSNVVGTLHVTDSTFSGNSANTEGGGVFNNSGATLTVTNSTFSGNRGGIIANSGTLTVTNSILASSTSGRNCNGTIVNGGYNISDDASCGFGSSAAANGNTIGDGVSDTNLALDPGGLANNGGPTETIALEAGSYAIDAIPLAQCTVTTDQRGDPRPAPGHNACDIGAYEYQASLTCASILTGAVTWTLDDYANGAPTSLSAAFTPKVNTVAIGLTEAEAICNVQYFDWQQTILQFPPPIPSSLGPASLYAVLPVNDPPGAQTYYDVRELPTGCAHDITVGGKVVGCQTPIESSDKNTLNYFDAPADPCLVGGTTQNQLKNNCPGSDTLGEIVFQTALVGINADGQEVPLPVSNVYKWEDNFDGTSGGIAALTNAMDVDPGSGTGGITITSINGVPQTPPSVSCSATPTTLWPPNGNSVLVTVSGVITPGTQSIPPGGTTYFVTDEYGQVQPSGGISLGAGGSYSFGVSLIAARDGSDEDGRTYTIVVDGKDTIGNVGACSALVIVPHDQGT